MRIELHHSRMQRSAGAVLTVLCSWGVAAQTATVVTIAPAQDVLRAAFTLPAAAERLVFESGYSRQRRDAWRPVGDGWRSTEKRYGAATARGLRNSISCSPPTPGSTTAVTSSSIA